MNKKFNVLVTGAAGYIGSHIVERLCDLKLNVIGIDLFVTGGSNISAVDSRSTFYTADVRDTMLMTTLLKQYSINCVIHLAGYSSVAESYTDPMKYYSNNVTGAISLLKAMEDANVKKLIFSSTAAVYKSYDYGIGADTRLITEKSEIEPSNPYGETKIAIENMIEWQHNAKKLEYVNLRYFNVAGASSSGNIGECHDPETHLIPNVLKVALGDKQALDIFGNNYSTDDGTCERDYIHIEDLVDAHILALDYLQTRSRLTCNLGSGRAEGYSVLQIAREVSKVTGKKIPLNFCDRRKGDPTRLVTQNDTFPQQQLGWKPTRTLEDIISSAWKWEQTKKQRKGE